MRSQGRSTLRAAREAPEPPRATIICALEANSPVGVGPDEGAGQPRPREAGAPLGQQDDVTVVPDGIEDAPEARDPGRADATAAGAAVQVDERRTRIGIAGRQEHEGDLEGIRGGTVVAGGHPDPPQPTLLLHIRPPSPAQLSQDSHSRNGRWTVARSSSIPFVKRHLPRLCCCCDNKLRGGVMGEILRRRTGLRTDLHPGEAAAIALAVAAGDIGALVEEVLGGHGLRSTEYVTLRILRGAGDEGLRHRDIRDRLLLGSPDLTRLLRRLEVAGYVARGPDPEDGRGVRHRATSAGLEALDTVEGPLSLLYDRLLNALGPECATALVRQCEHAMDVACGLSASEGRS